jgi:uncharacterized protein involved in exopolysaccharide biosynthesis
MKEYSTDEGEVEQRAHRLSPDKLVYVMPEQAQGGAMEDEISLKELWDILWKGKWLIIAITAVFAVGSVAYALLATEWYRAEVLLAPSEAESTPSIAGQLGGLAALAGVSVGGGGTAESVATLKSRDLAREFIESNELMSVLLHEHWDEAAEDWKGAVKADAPDMRDAVRVFHEKALRVREDRESGLVTVGVEWIDPLVAAEWASKLVQLANNRLRQRALQDAETNVAYLQAELASTSVVTLQQSIGRLLETEMQKLMLAKGNEEFVFRIVDTAEPAKRPTRPRRAVAVMVGTLLGGMISVFLVFIRHAIRTNEPT